MIIGWQTLRFPLLDVGIWFRKLTNFFEHLIEGALDAFKEHQVKCYKYQILEIQKIAKLGVSTIR